MNSEIGASGNLWRFTKSFCRCLSARSHLVTSKLAFAFYRRFNCLTFLTISSRSLMRLRSLLTDEILRERGRFLRNSSPPAESVTERSERAEPCRPRLRDKRCIDPLLRALLIRGAKTAVVGLAIFLRQVECFVWIIALILLNKFKLFFSISVALSVWIWRKKNQ